MRTQTAVDLTAANQTLRGPFGIVLTLAARQIVPGNPGEGTPMLLEYKGETMTLNCATQNVGELLGDDYTPGAASEAYRWIAIVYPQACQWEETQLDRLEAGKVAK